MYSQCFQIVKGAASWHTLPSFEVCALTAAKGVSLGSESIPDTLRRQAPN